MDRGKPKRLLRSSRGQRAIARKPIGTVSPSLGLATTPVPRSIPANIVGGATTTVFPLAVPSDLSLPGLLVTSQVVSDDLGANAFGWKLSNGLRLRIGA